MFWDFCSCLNSDGRNKTNLRATMRLRNGILAVQGNGLPLPYGLIHD
jgi:hypothetical protein